MNSTDKNCPLVSIAIPCYNHARFVESTLNSVLADDYPNKEIVLINDGSKDNSDDIIKDWIHQNKQLISIKYKSRPNAGICKTLNELVDLAEGKYLILIASDDKLVAGTISKRIDFLLAHPDKMVLVGDAEVIDENDNVVMQSSITEYNHGDKNLLKDDDAIILSTLIRPQISGPTIMVDKKIYDMIGKYRENLIAEDWYFYQRAAAKKLIIFDDMVVGSYRIHSSNTSGNNSVGSVKMARTIALTYWYNWTLMPTIKYKSMAILELAKWSMRYLIYKVKSWRN